MRRKTKNAYPHEDQEKIYETKRWFIFGIGLVLIAVVMSIAAVPHLSTQAKSKNWVGAWDVKVTVVKQNATIASMVSFFSDGNMLTDENPSPFETSGHGSWTATGNDKAAYTFKFIIGSADQVQWITGTVSGVVNYDEETDQWSGPFSISLVDQDGNEILADTGTMSGTRISVTP